MAPIDKVDVREKLPPALVLHGGVGGCPLEVTAQYADRETGVVVEAVLTHFITGIPIGGKAYVEYNVLVLPRCGHVSCSQGSTSYSLN